MALSGWRLAGDDVYTCVPPPGYEVDPAVLRAIHEFDPGVIPIWRIQVWIHPNSERRETFVHPGIGRYFSYPRYLRRQFHVTMPARVEHPVPNFLDAIFEDQKCARYLFEGGPGGYIPWDWATYEWCRRMYVELTTKKWDKIMAGKRDREAKARQSWREEIEYRKKQVEPYLIKKAAGIPDGDWDAYLKEMKRREQLRRRGQKPESINEKKTFVDLGSTRSPRVLGETYRQVAPAEELSK
jgi:hypothetical protein